MSSCCLFTSCHSVVLQKLFEFCFESKISLDNVKFPNFDKDVLLTAIANGNSFGAVCLTGNLRKDLSVKR